LDQITSGAQRSANLTRQLLAFARKQTIAPKVLDLNDTVSGMLKMLRRLIGEDMDLAWEPGANLGTVKMDPSQIDQILANLCVNARDAIGGVGKITIETENAELDANYCAAHAEAVPGAYVMLAVSDTGCGMDGETLERVFEPFYTTKEVGKGTGLGLATVHGIVKQNEGHITVYSEPGEGTTFRIYLPRFAEETREAEETVDDKTVEGGDETILLVEDEASVRITSGLFLEESGYTVLSAETPAEALKVAAEHTGGIDLLITDVVMPGMSGRDLADRLGEDFPDLKCLYMSGYTANVIAHRGILDEDVEFLSKPFSQSVLTRKVREVLSSEK
jgi:CheY-like chemotaxis protein